jgi:hypothetical protein
MTYEKVPWGGSLEEIQGVIARNSVRVGKDPYYYNSFHDEPAYSLANAQLMKRIMSHDSLKLSF